MGGCRPQWDSALWRTYGVLWFLVQKQSEFFILNYLPACNAKTELLISAFPPPLSKEELHSSKFSGQKPWSSSLFLLWTITCSVSKCFWLSLQHISRMQSLRITSAPLMWSKPQSSLSSVLTVASQWFSTLHHCHQVL